MNNATVEKQAIMAMQYGQDLDDFDIPDPPLALSEESVRLIIMLIDERHALQSDLNGLIKQARKVRQEIDLLSNENIARKIDDEELDFETILDRVIDLQEEMYGQ